MYQHKKVFEMRRDAVILLNTLHVLFNVYLICQNLRTPDVRKQRGEN